MFARSVSRRFFFLEMLGRTMVVLLSTRFRFREFLRQVHFFANESLFIVVFSVSFASVVMVIESSFHMKLVIQDDALVPGFVTLLSLRELGVVLAALLVTSRVGAGMAAMVGAMKITEQVEALEMLNIDPVQHLVVPRFCAGIAGGVILSVVSNAASIVCTMLVSSHVLGQSVGTYVQTMNRFVQFQDLIFALVKGGVFGAVIPLVSCYFGFRCKAGAEGVGLATTNSVVVTSVAIITIDFFLTWIFSQISL